jgi:uncharacterized protein (TIGR00251 family)
VPGARRSSVVGRHGDAWKLRIRATPERGRANAEVVDLLAGVLGLATRDVRIVAGQTGRDKLVEVDRLSLRDAEALLSSRREEER